MAELYANDIETALASSATSNADHLHVLAAAPAALRGGQFRILVDSELMLVTSGQDTTTWSVTRGVEGTAAAGHAGGASVVHVLTAASLAALVPAPSPGLTLPQLDAAGALADADLVLVSQGGASRRATLAELAAYVQAWQASAYPAAVLALLPVSYLRLGDAIGATAIAVAGANGTYQNSPTLGVAGAVAGDTAITLVGTSSQSVLVTPGATVVDAISYVFWAKRAATGQAQGIVRGTGANSLTVQFHAIDVILIARSQTSIAYSTETVADTNWHHVAVTKDGASFAIYLDGSPCTLNAPNNLTIASQTQFNWGYDDNGPYSGSLDEVAIFDRALTAGEVAGLWAAR